MCLDPCACYAARGPAERIHANIAQHRVRLGSSGRGEPAGKNLPEGDLGGIEVVESREAEDWCLD